VVERQKERKKRQRECERLRERYIEIVRDTDWERARETLNYRETKSVSDA
jgi:hypothetical protein